MGRRRAGLHPAGWLKPEGGLVMIEATDEVVGQMAEAIAEVAHPERIILFGSLARGDASAGDVDLLVIESEPFGHERSRRQETLRIRKALSRFRLPKDILVYSAAEVAEWRNSPNHIVARCLREGKVVYERS